MCNGVMLVRGSLRLAPIIGGLNFMVQLTKTVFLQSLPSVLAMIFAWLVEQTLMRGEWRCVSMGCGGQFVVLVGTPEMLLWCANSLDTRTHVRFNLLSLHACIMGC